MAQQDLVINSHVTIPASELQISFARSGGPGGQNVNKVESKAVLRWSVRESRALTDADKAWLLSTLRSKLTVSGELVIAASSSRDQIRNREDASARLAILVAQALKRPKKRKKTRPSKSAREERIKDKKKVGARKADRRRRDDD